METLEDNTEIKRRIKRQKNTKLWYSQFYSFLYNPRNQQSTRKRLYWYSAPSKYLLDLTLPFLKIWYASHKYMPRCSVTFINLYHIYACLLARKYDFLRAHLLIDDLFTPLIWSMPYTHPDPLRPSLEPRAFWLCHLTLIIIPGTLTLSLPHLPIKALYFPGIVGYFTF